jgi:16S rRNA (cytidine1402-2'-O)-methyltransferase
LPPPEPGRLFLVPTPIGNLEDVTLRALRVLRQVDWVAAEDTRRARVLFQAHEIRTPVLSHHAHNEHREAPKLVARLLRGESGALVTDAGSPGLCDPGFLLAREARRAGVVVEVLPGPSAVTTALVASGFPPEPFVFQGYLPAVASRRRRLLEDLRAEPRAVVLFETPHRIRRALEDVAALLPDRPVALLRELTKLHEEAVRGTAAEVLAAIPGAPRGEIALVLGPLARAARRRAHPGGGRDRAVALGRDGGRSREPDRGAAPEDSMER